MLRVRTRDAIAFQIGVAIFLSIILFIILIPLWRVIVTAFVPLDTYTREGIPFFLAPWDWTVEAFRQLITHSLFPRALLNSFIITGLGTIISLLLTIPMAYGLSVKNLPGRNFFMILILFTYLFSPGLIPVYLLITRMGLTDNFLAIILPPAVSVYNTLVMMRFFEGLPDELREAAALDGANEFQILWNVMLPLSKPIILTIGLFYAVYFWNEFFTPILYLNDHDLMPLPVLLRNILISASFNEYVEYDAFSSSALESLKAAGVLITMLPMLAIYPWIQRYFTKGTLVGGVKE
ncbi:MAG: carbohydrate ABC transporter permease [Anaerolineaceae bacterium]|nr:carbohydrate ABC transporter permease [Anaerolineaceae bacterium]MBN2677837.1 carbohydrate ABC transporter permease [Anaerolineaceae bacterium]